MRFDSLYSPEPTQTWDYAGGTNTTDVDWRDQRAVVEHFRPHVVVSMSEVAKLNEPAYGRVPPNLTEATYKDLASLIDGDFLNQEVRASQLRGVREVGFKPENTMNFHVDSSEFSNNRIKYTNSVLFDQWEEIGSDPDFNFMERARLLLWVGDVRLHCTCPSFLYHGYQYMCTVLDAAIYPEERFPRINNPAERGIVCKHMNRTMKVLPFHSGSIAKELKKQFG